MVRERERERERNVWEALDQMLIIHIEIIVSYLHPWNTFLLNAYNEVHIVMCSIYKSDPVEVAITKVNPSKS